MDKVIIADGLDHTGIVGVGGFQRDLRRFDDAQRVGHKLDVESDLDGHTLNVGVDLGHVIAVSLLLAAMVAYAADNPSPGSTETRAVLLDSRAKMSAVRQALVNSAVFSTVRVVWVRGIMGA